MCFLFYSEVFFISNHRIVYREMACDELCTLNTIKCAYYSNETLSSAWATQTLTTFCRRLLIFYSSLFFSLLFSDKVTAKRLRKSIRFWERKGDTSNPSQAFRAADEDTKKNTRDGITCKRRDKNKTFSKLGRLETAQTSSRCDATILSNIVASWILPTLSLPRSQREIEREGESKKTAMTKK